MDMVPRLPMIFFERKISPDLTIFSKQIRQYIHDFYEEDPDSYKDEIINIEKLRLKAVNSVFTEQGCSLLKKYYCQLHFLQRRFPMEMDGAAAVTFRWRSAYSSDIYSIADIRFEIKSVLYNIGAYHMHLAARAERNDDTSLKKACTYFQCAAWAFNELINWYRQPNFIKFAHQLCLAQAQECVLEKSLLGNQSSITIVKLAQQVVNFYSLALCTLVEKKLEKCDSKVYKCWKRYAKFKRSYYIAVTYLYQGMVAEEQTKMGQRIAFYNASLLSLKEAEALYANGKSIIGLTGLLHEKKDIVGKVLTFIGHLIKKKQNKAQMENEHIYHEQVPNKNLLPTITGVSLVKEISFAVNDIKVSGPDIFARLVPIKVHEKNSIYSEAKAKIIRSISIKINECDQQLDMFLMSLKLEHLDLWQLDTIDLENKLQLPDELLEKYAAFNEKPHIIRDLVNTMKNISDTYHDVESMLKEVDTLLTVEQYRNKKYQKHLKSSSPDCYTFPITQTMSLSEKAKKFNESHKTALEKSEALHKVMTLHKKNLQILAQPLDQIMTHVMSPTGKNGIQTVNKREEMNQKIRELKLILGRVDEMRKQRFELYTKLKEAIDHDDLTGLLITKSDTGSIDQLFAENLKKHKVQVNLIEQNLSAQDNILMALTEAYDKTAGSRKAVEEVLKYREKTISSLIFSYDSHESLLSKSSNCFDVYHQLKNDVSELLKRLKVSCKVHQEARSRILDMNDSVMPSIHQNRLVAQNACDQATFQNNPFYTTNNQDFGNNMNVNGSQIQYQYTQERADNVASNVLFGKHFPQQDNYKSQPFVQPIFNENSDYPSWPAVVPGLSEKYLHSNQNVQYGGTTKDYNPNRVHHTAPENEKQYGGTDRTSSTMQPNQESPVNHQQVQPQRQQVIKNSAVDVINSASYQQDSGLLKRNNNIDLLSLLNIENFEFQQITKYPPLEPERQTTKVKSQNK